jgi:uncharacterized protein DUF6210
VSQTRIAVREVETIELTLEQDFFGLIYPCLSGFCWTNQVGGTQCGHPRLEGIYVPLPDVGPRSGENPMYDWYVISEESYQERALPIVQKFLATSEFLSEWFKPLESWDEVPPPKIVAEAWVPVRCVEGSHDHYIFEQLLRPFFGKVVVLTHPNSD